MSITIAGHRPGRFRDPTVAERVREWINGILDEKYEVHVYTGMALGVDQWVAEECANRSIPFTAVVPFEGQELLWSVPQKHKYRALLMHAAEVITLAPGPYSLEKMKARNEYMVDHSTEVYVVWDGIKKGGTYHTYWYANQEGKLAGIFRP